MAQYHPAWLDKTFLATVLQGKDNGPQVTVEKFSVKPAVATGTNYTSYLFRVLVEYTVEQGSKKKSVSLIVKAPIQKGLINELSEQIDFFAKEPNIYSKLLPQMNKMVNFEFAPKSFYCPVKYGIVLKDMVTEGYIMSDKIKQLDFHHCKLVYMNLAKFHASSVAVYHDDPELIKDVSQEFVFTDDGPLAVTMKAWLESAVQHTASILNEMEGQKQAANLLSSKIDHLWKSLVNIFKPKQDGFNVLNHGDCWASNMLFKYNESGDVIDMKFIDFQIARFTSPAIDLIYFLWSSGNEDVRENHQKELFTIYRQTLNSALEEFGCAERLSYEELQEDLKSASDLILSTICVSLPFMICDPEDSIDLGILSMEDVKDLKNDKRFQKMYGENYRALLPGIIRQIQPWLSDK